MSNSRLTLFDSPLFLGFEHFEEALLRLGKAAGSGYPPYNIEQTSPNRLRITVAVAGFQREDLEVEIEHNQLTIRGRQTEEESRVFLHRGIAARQFQRSFVLADGIEVEGADLDSGLLNIELLRILPEPNARKVEIRAGETGRQSVDTTEKSAGSRVTDFE